ncbi:MAG: TRAP transporter permease [Deltaproteobacteria bacterium]|nr:TRAP transporter permease [Deltaproteobacteria bacterium]
MAKDTTAKNEALEAGEPKSWMLTKGIFAIGVIFSVYHILIIMNVFEWLGFGSISAISHRAISLGLILIMVIILYPFKEGASPRTSVPWMDYTLMGLSVIVCAYIVVYYELGWMDPSLHGVSEQYRDTVEIILGVTAILLVLEATRRVMGLALPLIAFLFVLYTIFSNHFPGFLQARGYSMTRIVGHLYIWSEGIWGVAMGVAAITIVGFIIFSSFITETGAGNFFTDIANATLGTKRGGPAKAVIISDALFGMVSGSTTASVMTTGVFTIPMMRKVGYSANFAGAVEAVAANGGQIMPPVMGAVVFIMCEFLQMPYREVVLASIIPALLYWLVLYLTIDYNAALQGMKGLSKAELPSLSVVLKRGWFYFLPLIALIYLLVVVALSPERSALSAVVVLLVACLFFKDVRMGPKRILKALALAGRSMVLVTSACATAGIIIGCMTLTGLGSKLSTMLLTAAQGEMFLLLLFSAIACYILGMGMSSIPVYLTVAILVAPALVKFGISPMAAHLFVFWWALTSFITPPVAIAAYAVASLSGGDPFRTGFEAMRLGAGIYVIPFMFVYRPGLLLMDSVGGIVLATVICILGVYAAAAALTGYFLTKTKIWERLSLFGGALLIVFPGWMTWVGLIMIAIPMATQVLARKALQKVAV